MKNIILVLMALAIAACGDNDYDLECVEAGESYVASSNVPPATCPPLGSTTSTTFGVDTTTTTLHDHCEHWYCDE